MAPFWHELLWFLGFCLGVAILVHVLLRAYFDVRPSQLFSGMLARLRRGGRR